MSWQNQSIQQLQQASRSIKDQWIDNGNLYDAMLGILFGVAAFTILNHTNSSSEILEPRLSSLYQLISSSCANILGFVAATLTIVSGFGSDLAGAFNRKQFDKLFAEFYKAFAATMFCFISPMLAILSPSHTLAVAISTALGFFLSSILRVVVLVFEINNKIIDSHLERKLEQERQEQDN